MTSRFSIALAGLAAAIFTLLLLMTGNKEVLDSNPPYGFPPAAVDYFAAMDDGLAVAPDEVRGRNTWLMWTAGNEAFWNDLAQHSFGGFDLLKLLDSRNREIRFTRYGLINEPGFKKVEVPDRFGLWLDVPDGTRDPSKGTTYVEEFPKEDFLRIYGSATGIVGLRLFPNPQFDETARRRWNAERFYGDKKYYQDTELVRPYRVGMACAFCHVGPHPLHPPADTEHPGWQNLSSNIGNQYFNAASIFMLPGQENNFLYQIVNSMAPGTVDTSALASDGINNPRNMNAIYAIDARGGNAAEEELSDDNLAMIGTQRVMKVPHVLKDGADSIGLFGALARVYVSIGAFSEEWRKHFNLLVGIGRQTPFEIAVARRDSDYFRATLDRLPDVVAFFQAIAKPHPLARAPGGPAYLDDSAVLVERGQQVFAENCAGCHSSYSKMPPPPAGVLHDTPDWDRWVNSEAFKIGMVAKVKDPDFLDNNFLSTDRRIPISVVGTNACAALASNALEGHIWDGFSSETYKNLPAAGSITVDDPITGEKRRFAMPGGGRGYMRVPSLVSIWASAPYLHNNSVGRFTGDPSVAGRMAAFQDGIEQLLWPDKRQGMNSIYRTTKQSTISIHRSSIPKPLFRLLKNSGPSSTGDADTIAIGPIPKGTPVNLLANLDLGNLLDPTKLMEADNLAQALRRTIREIGQKGLRESPALELLKQIDPVLLDHSKCPDFVTDRGHPFGSMLSDEDKRALIGYLERL